MDPRMTEQMLPPAPDTSPELPRLVEFDPSLDLWSTVAEEDVDTWRPTGEP